MAKTSLKIPLKKKKVVETNNHSSENAKIDFVLNNLLSILFYLLSFFIFYSIKRNTLIIEPEYVQVVKAVVISVIVGSILSNKINLSRKHDFSLIFRKNYISLIFSLGILSLLFFVFDISFTSRFILLGTFILGSLLDTAYFIFFTEHKRKVKLLEKTRLSFNYFLVDGIILSLVNLFKIFLPNKFVYSDEKYLAASFVTFISWIFSGAITHRFNPIEYSQNKWHAFSVQLKFYSLNISLIAISLYVLQISENYWKIFLESTLLYSGLSLMYFIYKFSEQITNKTDEAVVSFLKSYELNFYEEYNVHENLEGKYQLNKIIDHESNLKQALQFEYLSENKSIFTFVDRKIELKSIDAKKSIIIRSIDPYNIKVLSNHSHEFIMNLHELNDFRRINEYIKLVNLKLVNDGIYVGCFIPNRNRHGRFLKKYSFFLGNLIYFLDFILKRVLPKMPIIRNFYLKITRGRDRALSLTEGLGRLVFGGFEILDIAEINDYVFFAAKKVREPNIESNHHYSTIFKMRRVGKNGKPIFVYKFRTMHPYSEFLQEYVYTNNKLEGGGKFKSDFRIPIWGKFMRKLWIDELPMIFNWIKGDLKLIGVRPISFHYLKLYSKDHQIYRSKFKPGLAPPFYADLPKTIEDIEASEAKYLQAYEHNPIITDIKYFFRIFHNIIIRKKRSA
jgi:lipopolysaccharide/colanic/teichoic acid biosynthesis glycosyltransferase